MPQLSDSRIRELIDLIRAYRHARQRQQSRGLNDFNVFTTLLKANDERRLHSQFIALLLNPKGTHGQGDLFLRLFLRQCVRTDTGLDTAKCRVFPEYLHRSTGNLFDIYLTDGRTHLVIENKIDASDGDRQIQRYVEAIKSTGDRPPDPSDLVLVYLSMHHAPPAPASLDVYKIIEHNRLGEALEHQDAEDIHCMYRAINYETDIQPWIIDARTEVANITNLNVALTQYIEVINKLYGRYKEKTMNLASYLNRTGDWNFEDLRDLDEMVSGFPDVKKRLISDLLSRSREILEQKIAGDYGWSVNFDETGNELSISHLNFEPMKYLLCFKQDQYSNPYYAFTSYYKQHYEKLQSTRQALLENKGLQSHLKEQSINFRSQTELFWIGAVHQRNLFELTLGHGIEAAAGRISNEFYEFFDSSKDVVRQLNSP